MCCRKIDEDDNDAGIEDPEDMKTRRPCNRYRVCVCVAWLVIIAAVSGTVISLGYLFMQPGGPPCTLELVSNRTDSLCSYNFNNTIITRSAYRIRSSTTRKRVWICPELCLSDVDGETTINNCDEDCGSPPGWIAGGAIIGFFLCAVCCAYVYETYK
jgi:hypothetical protein